MDTVKKFNEYLLLTHLTIQFVPEVSKNSTFNLEVFYFPYSSYQKKPENKNLKFSHILNFHQLNIFWHL